MKCPYCDKEMIKGYIPPKSSIINWNPDGEKQGIFIFSGPSKNGIQITYNKKRVAHYCKGCNKLIIDFNEDNKI
jgi:hypothetical protein